jgi:hypothetical protein
LPDSLTTTPFGSLTIGAIKLPDYVRDLKPIKVSVFTDKILTDIVIEDPYSTLITKEHLTPGYFTAELFRPSNYYAMATNVVYYINVRP